MAHYSREELQKLTDLLIAEKLDAPDMFLYRALRTENPWAYIKKIKTFYKPFMKMPLVKIPQYINYTYPGKKDAAGHIAQRVRIIVKWRLQLGR